MFHHHLNLNRPRRSSTPAQPPRRRCRLPPLRRAFGRAESPSRASPSPRAKPRGSATPTSALRQSFGEPAPTWRDVIAPALNGQLGTDHNAIDSRSGSRSTAPRTSAARRNLPRLSRSVWGSLCSVARSEPTPPASASCVPLYRSALGLLLLPPLPVWGSPPPFSTYKGGVHADNSVVHPFFHDRSGRSRHLAADGLRQACDVSTRSKHLKRGLLAGFGDEAGSSEPEGERRSWST